MILASPDLFSFYLEYQKAPSRSDYNIVFDQKIVGDLDIVHLQKALKQFVTDHVIFNSHLVYDNEKLYWQKNDSTLKLIIFDSNKLEHEFSYNPFNLEKGPLYRFGLFKNGPNQYNFLMVMHHVLIDGSSFDEYIDTISSYYNKTINNSLLISKQKQDIQKLSERIETKIKTTTKHGTIDFWEDKLKNAPLSNNLPSLSSLKTVSHANVRFKINKGSFKNRQPLTINNYFMLVWGILLARYCNQERLTIRYPRAIKQGQKLYCGAQVNTYLYPFSIDDNDTLQSLGEKLQLHIKSLKPGPKVNYADLPIETIINYAPIENLNIGFAQTNLKILALSFDNCHIAVQNRYDISIANASIAFEYNENENNYDINIKYRDDVLAQHQIERLIEHFKNSLTHFSTYNNLNFNFLGNKEYQTLVYDWNQTETDFDQTATIVSLFANSVATSPNATALVFEDKTLTYAELDSKSNQLAHHIQDEYQRTKNQPLKADTLITICVEPSLDMVIGILGILKAGAAYVPIEPDYPDARIQFILEDCNAALILTQLALLPRIETMTHIHCLALDGPTYTNAPITRLDTQPTAHHLAYVIYTSGTTGKPKGVMVEHNDIVYYINTFSEVLLDNKACISIFTLSYAFDASLPTLLAPLFNEGTVIITAALRHFSPETYQALLYQHHVNLIKATPAMLSLIAQVLEHHAEELSIVMGGETFSLDMVNSLIKNKRIHLYNQYGPTENIVGSCLYHIDAPIESQIIGQAYAGKNLYIVDANMQPVPFGVMGELYIGGAGLARGYLNQPLLTKERFINNPFTEGKLLYKTGDLARRLLDGNIEYLGRNDSQVKLHGYRIELSEINAVLSKKSGIEQCVAQIKNIGERELLVLFYVTTSSPTITTSDLKEFLLSKLPSYICPSFFIEIETIPITTNGKVDEKSLEKHFNNYISKTNKIRKNKKPLNSTQKIIHLIWEKLLIVKEFDIDDNLFDLGGNSILPLQLKQKIEKGLKLNNVKITDLFKYPTIETYSAHFQNQDKSRKKIFKTYCS